MRSPPLNLLLVVSATLAACGVVSPPPPTPQAPSPPMSQATAPSQAVAAPPPALPVASAPPAKSVSAAPPKSVPAAPAKLAPPVAAKAPAIVVAAAPLIDLKSLEQKLKDSKAIGVMTKLSLKNQVDDLVAQFRALHEGRQPPTLAQLRQPYELLLMKVLSLLQDGDPALAKALNDSRDYIWGVLADRNKFLANT